MRIGIIGGGAAGMAAAGTAAECGAQAVILEKNDRIGKKLLATGNGKCNLSNLQFSCGCYHSSDPQRLPPILAQFTVQDTLAFFRRLGLMTKEKNGYVYPQCEQASAVLDVLRFALEYRNVELETDCRVVGIEKTGKCFLVHIERNDGHYVREFDRIILACGSKAGLKKETDENGMELAAALSLRRIPYTPALVQLRCGEPFFKALAGVRCHAQVMLATEEGELAETGELQLTDYGISGIPVFQLSGYAVRALRRQKTLPAFLDFMPDTDEETWDRALLARRKMLEFENMEQFFTGTIHKKIVGVILKLSGIRPQDKVGEVPAKRLLEAGQKMKRLPVTVTGANGFAQAQVCAGGIRLTEMTDCLETRRHRGLYAAGEMLDVDGRCGGYNLQWAWTSGVVAGRAAAGTVNPHRTGSDKNNTNDKNNKNKKTGIGSK